MFAPGGCCRSILTLCTNTRRNDTNEQLELAYINTSHPDFIGGSRAIAEVMDRNRMANGGAGVAGAGDVRYIYIYIYIFFRHGRVMGDVQLGVLNLLICAKIRNPAQSSLILPRGNQRFCVCVRARVCVIPGNTVFGEGMSGFFQVEKT